MNGNAPDGNLTKLWARGKILVLLECGRSRCRRHNYFLTRSDQNVRDGFSVLPGWSGRPKKKPSIEETPMKRNTLFALVALALGGTSVAQAQDFGSWYVAPRIGVAVPDSDRDTKSGAFFGIGVGVWYNPNFSIDFEYGIDNHDYKSS